MENLKGRWINGLSKKYFTSTYVSLGSFKQWWKNDGLLKMDLIYYYNFSVMQEIHCLSRIFFFISSFYFNFKNICGILFQYT